MSKKTSKSDPHAAREAAKYERPIPSREFIADHIKRRGQPATYAELLEELKLDDEEMQDALHRRIKAMIRDEQLERLRGGYFWPAGKRILVEGKVAVEKGRPPKTWVIPNDGSNRILLSLDDAHAVYTGNRVIVSTIEMKGEQPREGKLAEIIEQQRIVVTGRFVREAGFCHVIPHGKEVVQNILIPQGKEQDAEDGMIVVVALERQSTRWTEPLGQVLEVLGSENTPGIEIKAAMRAYNLPHVWPEGISKETSQLTEEVPNAAKRGRLDLREIPLVTIDGEDAKDFDDAVFCEEKRDGGFRLTVAIADVSFYVRPGTALDAEASERGTSVYFPGQVIPMLPEILSNGLCSLKPEVDRLCMVCIMSINNQGKTTRYEFQEGIMRSYARLTYTKVAALLTEGNEKLKEQYAVLLPHLQSLHKLYQILKNAREERGAIDFETVETRIIFGKDGKINKIEPVQRNDAHRLIEECMLSANVACARFLKKHKLPGLYRNHEGPPEEKLADLKVFLNELGLPLGGGQKPQPLDYAALLRSIQKRPDANIIQMVLLRSLSQAVYSKDNLGHFGLAYPAYCHFTSPIRRYPDLLVHRQIRAVLRGQWTEKKIEEANTDAFQESLVKLGAHTSTTERRADDATRDAVRWLKCQYIQKHLGEEFDGIISGVTRFGFFVELKDIYIDGLVHVTSLRNDYYYFDSIHHRLVGERSGIEYKLGGSVKVKVIKVDIDDRKIDFELLGAPEAIGKKHKRPKSKKGGDQKPDIAKNKKNSRNRRSSKKPTDKNKKNAKKRAD
ncbi:MAG TPA: ribonuclease R [Gammaproteobacteria bacterium]|nr:ribonuclease R [Gammaproteobacteria bacterium]